MVWYPTVDDIVCLNMLSLEMSHDKHPHRLLWPREAIEAKIDLVIRRQETGLVRQAALLIKELIQLHAFGSGNHRTAYAVTKSFLIRNGRKLRVTNWDEAYPFIRNVETKSIEEIERWIEHGEEEQGDL